MAVAYRNSTQANAASGAIAPAIPAGTTTSDVMLAIYQAAATTTTWTGPTGWTPVLSLSGLAVYWRAWQSGDGAPSATPSTGASSAAVISFSGADTLTPFDFGSTATKSAVTTFATAAFYNTITGSMLTVIAGSIAQASFTEQASITEVQDVNTASRPGLGLGYEATTLTAGSQAARTVTASPSATGSSIAIAIRPANDPSIACDNLTGTADTQVLSTAGTALSVAHTVGVGNNRILLVSVETALSQAGDPTVAKWTPTGGTAENLILLDSVHPGSSGNLYLYYRLNPTSGAGTVAVTSQTSSKAVVGVISFANVDQTTIFRSGQTGGNAGGTTTHFSSTSSAAPTVTVATQSGDWTYDTVAQFATTNALTMTTQTSRIQSYNATSSGGAGSTNVGGAASVMVAPAASQFLAWSLTAANVAEIGCALMEAATGTPISGSDSGTASESTDIAITLSDSGISADTITSTADGSSSDAVASTDTSGLGVTSSDGAVGNETGAPSLAPSDTATGINTSGIGFAQTDTGTTTDSEAVSQPTSDAGTATDAAAITAIANDAGTETDLVQLTATLAAVDTGIATETRAITFALSDTATASETSTSSANFTVSDSGAGTDTTSVNQGGTSKSASDSGTVSDANSTTAVATFSDSAIGTDTTSLTLPLLVSDAAVGIEVVTLIATVAIVDTGSASDVLISSKSFGTTDTTTGTDTPVIQVASPTDGATTTAAVQTVASLATSDGAIGSEDTATTALFAALDSIVGLEAMLRSLAAFDAATTAETAVVVKRNIALAITGGITIVRVVSGDITQEMVVDGGITITPAFAGNLTAVAVEGTPLLAEKTLGDLVTAPP